MRRRIAYLIVTIVLLLIMSLPILAFALAARGELTIGNIQGSYLRLFLVNSDEAEGIGFQRLRQSAGGGDCQQGSVRYFLWEGQSRALNADYCTCLDPRTGQETNPGRCIDGQ